MRSLLSVACLLIAIQSFSQDKSLTFSGYGELYYSYDFSKIVDEEKPNFIYNHKKLEAIQANLAYVKAAYSSNSLRANLALMGGNYPRYNLAAEPSWARVIFEANVGLKLTKKRNIWLDGGVMPSHIGFESAVGADCWTLTRSILAENSPYCETGVKLSAVSKNEKWNTALLVLNGWQKIKRPEGIKKPSFGAQVNFKPNKKLTVNYSNFMGSDKPDSLKITRIFHNLYSQIQVSKNFDLLLGFDFGTEFDNKQKKSVNWYSPVLISKVRIKNNHTLAFRFEHYADPYEAIISTESKTGFQTFGASINYDYRLSENMLWRIEPKLLNTGNQLSEPRNDRNISITTAITLKI